MNSVKCSYPGCWRMVYGKGLFCDLHGPKPGTVSRLTGTEDDYIAHSEPGTPITVGGDGGCGASITVGGDEGQATGTPITVGGDGEE